MLYDSLLAFDIATERVDDVFGIEFKQRWEAREARRAAELAAETADRPSFARRALAQGLATVSRGSAAAVRQLDDVVADDLRRILAAAK
jgi:hypothetical protein